MTKLIAAGCSNTAQNPERNSRDDRYGSRGIITWPQIVADRMGWDFVNIALPGCSNAYIENSIYDAVESTPNNEDIVVMSLWTCPVRFGIWGMYDVVNIDLSAYEEHHHSSSWDAEIMSRFWPDTHIEDWQDKPASYFKGERLQKYLICQLLSQTQWDYKGIMKDSARCINRTMNWLDDIGIKNYHEAGLAFVQHTPPDDEKYIEYGESLKLKLDHWKLGFTHELQESQRLPCRHPNQGGQDVIAKMFIDKMEGKYVPLNTHSLRGKSAKIEAFVYD